MPTSSSPAPDPRPTTLSFRALVSLAWHGAWFIVIVAAIAGITAFAVTRRSPPVYEATASLLVTHPGSRYAGTNVIAPPSVDAAVYQSALLEAPIVADALTQVDGRPPTDAQIRTARQHLTMSVKQSDASSTIDIRFRADRPDQAANMANAVAEALISWDRNRVRETFARTISTLQRSIQALDAQIQASSGDTRASLTALRDQRTRDLQSVQALNDSSVTVALLQPLALASAPSGTVGPRVVLKTFVAVVLGLIVGFGLLILRFTLDTKVRAGSDLAGLTGLPVLAEFPRPKRPSHRLSGEVASVLRTNLLFAAGYQAPLVIAVTSAQEPSEKAGVAASLAESFARAGRTTLLVDGDLRSAATSAAIDVEAVDATPLETYLEDPDAPFEPVAVAIDGKRSFDFVPSPEPAAFPVELLSNGFPDRLASWQQDYECIVIDAAPVLPSADTLSIAPYCSHVVLSASLDTSLRAAVAECMRMLGQGDVDVIGTVLINAVRTRNPRWSDTYERYSLLDVQSVDPYRTIPRDPDGTRTGARAGR